MFRLNHLFKQADAVQRYLAAPLTRSRLAYLAHRAEQSYGRKWCTDELSCAACLC